MPASLFAKRFHIPFQVKDGTKVTVVAERYSKVAEPPRHGRILICCHAVSASEYVLFVFVDFGRTPPSYVDWLIDILLYCTDRTPSDG